MSKTLEELDQLAVSMGFGGAHNAITCAGTYRSAYSEYLHKSNKLERKINALKELLPTEMVTLIDKKMEEEDPDEN